MSNRENITVDRFQDIVFNNESPYKREIVKIELIQPEDCRIVFHTAASLLEKVDPSFCQSFDYCFSDKPLPVSFVLPYPHVNRVRGFSEVWSEERRKAQNEFGYSHSYLVIRDRSGFPYAQIRLGSQMQGAFLLAAENNGSVLKVKMRVEGGIDMEEWIAVKSLSVVDHFQFRESSPVGFGTGGRLETHTSISIPQFKIVGYHDFESVIDLFKKEERDQLIILKRRLMLSRAQGSNPLAINFKDLNEGGDYLFP